MDYKVKVSFTKISKSKAKLKVDTTKNILSKALLREKNNHDFSLDRIRENVICTGENITSKSNE